MVGNCPAGAGCSATSTAHDVNRFFSTLAGRLLKTAALAATRTTVPVPQERIH